MGENGSYKTSRGGGAGGCTRARGSSYKTTAGGVKSKEMRRPISGPKHTHTILVSYRVTYVCISFSVFLSPLG